jgi:hypothetical protein
MKIWKGYGSEHSSNLVMIGRFKTVADAQKTKEVIDKLVEAVSTEDRSGERRDRYGGAMLELLSNLNVHSVSPSELEQFSYDISVSVKDDQIVVRTDEVDVSGYLKVLFDKGARIEVFSAHDYPEAQTSQSDPS